MEKLDKDFELRNLPIEAQDPEISEADFVLQDSDKIVHEQKFQTKPTTFFKDSLKRFAKNKSSVVAAGILGILILLSIFVPIISPYDVSTTQDAALSNLAPKLFDNANGFWDGTEKLSNIPLNTNVVDEITLTPLPDPDAYPVNGIVGGAAGIKVSNPRYTDKADKYGYDGYALIGFYGSQGVNSVHLQSTNPEDFTADLKDAKFELDLNASTITLVSFESVDLDRIRELEDDNSLELPSGYVLGNTSLEFNYYDIDEGHFVAVPILEPAIIHNIGGGSAINVSELITTVTGLSKFSNFYFTISVTPLEGTPASASVCGLVRNMVLTTSSEEQNEKDYFATDLGNELHGISFNNAMTFISRRTNVGSGSNTRTNRGYWKISTTNLYAKKIYLGKCVYGSFTFDTYAATLGSRKIQISLAELENYRRRGWISLDYYINDDDPDHPFVEYFDMEIRNRAKCPLEYEVTKSDVISVSVTLGKPSLTANAQVTYYKYLGFDKMPKFLFGTDKGGRDMFKYVFEGLRNSLILGVLTFVICFLFGLVWGAVSGYFGGTVDLVMERLTDILSGMPWIVLMTLVILHLGSNFSTFLIALCLTGWIGTASTTRTQFYRFRGREYVLASRTLGASDARLIAKHILPNAMGTIITGAVLMIPSVIFSEATISYLGLGFQNLSSLGVILSSNQSELFNHPYQLIFPSVVIALVMISFNLFGNGLRDAINPSLKGEGE